ncbi:MAG: O-antigen ligase family protein [Victivallales bacterium]|nr:O-antigen ligase family protein [Victivallales bacterium]MCF7888853.1 O-antigen ligase family protein [Victivallales bacterium]
MADSTGKQKDNSVDFFLFLCAFSIFISILKFGTPAALPGAFIFPLNTAEWIIFSWPPVFFTTLSAVILLWAAIYNKGKLRYHFSYGSYLLCLIWFFLALFSFSGFLNASCNDFAVMQCFYIAGIASFSIFVFFISNSFDKENLIKYLLGSVFWAALIIVLYGLYQYFYGFQATRNTLSSFTGNEKLLLNPGFSTRLMQNYIFSTFSLTNTLSGFLILTFPVCTWFSYRYTSKIQFKYIFSVLVFTIFISAIFLTGSRSGILSLGLSTMLMLLLFFSKKIKLSLFLLLFTTVVILFYLMQVKGDLSSSIAVRLDYYKVALKLFMNNPVSGSGWGTFFYHYGFLKSVNSPEAAHTVHNYILNTTSQAGIFSGIFNVAAFLFPIILIGKKIYQHSKSVLTDYRFYIFYGLVSLFFHMLFEVDFQIPAIILTAVLFSFLGMLETGKIQTLQVKNKLTLILYILSAALITAICFFSLWILPARYKLQQLKSACFPIPILRTTNKKPQKKELKRKISHLLEKTVNAYPSSPTPWAVAGNFYLKQKNWVKAEKCFKNAIKRSPERASFYYKLAISQAFQKKLNVSVKNFKKAKDLFPNLYKKRYNNIMDKLNK